MNALIRLLVAGYAPLHARYVLVDVGSKVLRPEKLFQKEPVLNNQVINLDALDFHAVPVPPAAAHRFDARIGDIGQRLGAKKLGYNLTVIAPGKRAFPCHHHHVNEEMFFVVAGAGEVRIGDTVRPIRPGDVIACPPGGSETAHQIINTSTDEDLRVLAVSTQLSPEVCEYPDSGKFAISLQLPANEDGKPQAFRFVSRAEQSLEYWSDEW